MNKLHGERKNPLPVSLKKLVIDKSAKIRVCFLSFWKGGEVFRGQAVQPCVILRFAYPKACCRPGDPDRF